MGGLVLLMSGIHLMSIVQQQGKWCMLYDTQVSLTLEKNAMESLLSMICDASFWLSAKGNFVSRSNAHLDSVMGQAMLGLDISQMMKDNERQKFLNRLSVPGVSAVTLFRTSLLTSSSQAVEAELFIVDRRSTKEASKSGDSQETCYNSDAMGFLVGLRLCEPFAIEPLQSNARECTSTAPSMLERASACNVETGSEHLGNHLSSNVTRDITCGLAAQATATDPRPQSSPLRVSFANDVSDTQSSSSRASSTKSALRRRTLPAEAQYPAHSGPIRGSPFQESGTYLKECSMSLIEDLVSCWNFDVQGCCPWHAYLKHLGMILQSLRGLHSCSEKWQPEVIWQCHNCMALLGPSHPSDSCWLCYEPRQHDSPS